MILEDYLYVTTPTLTKAKIAGMTGISNYSFDSLKKISNSTASKQITLNTNKVYLIFPRPSVQYTTLSGIRPVSSSSSTTLNLYGPVLICRNDSYSERLDMSYFGSTTATSYSTSTSYYTMTSTPYITLSNGLVYELG